MTLLRLSLIALLIAALAGAHGAEIEDPEAESGPSAAEVVEGLIQSLLVQDRWEAALDLAREHQEGPAAGLRLTAALGECLLRAGEPEAALELLGPLEDEAELPARGLVTLAHLRGAAGRHESAFELTRRAVERAPMDRFVLWGASEHAETRAEAIRRLERYLDLSDGDDPENVASARSTLGIWRELGERQVWVPRNRPDRIELPLRQIWNERGERLGYVIEARISGRKKPVRLLLDTGSTGLFLVDRMIKKRGFEPLGREVAYGGGGSGRHDVRRGLLAELSIGGLDFADAMVTTTRSELDPIGRFHGLVGLFVFSGYRVTLDLRKERLILEPGREEDSVEAVGVPYWMFSGQMLVRAGVVEGPDGMFLFDSGASSSVLSERLAGRLEQARPLGQASVRGFGGRVRGASRVGGLSLTFEGIESRSEVLSVVDLSLSGDRGGVELSGYLGLDLLEGKRWIVDTVSRRIQADDAADAAEGDK